MPVAVWATVTMSWGASNRNPLVSAGGPSYLLPPSSTIIGAIARGIAKLKGWGELTRLDKGAYSTAFRLAKHILAAGAGLLEGSLAPVNLTNRYLAIPYLRPENRKNRALWFGAQAMGYVFAGDARLCIAAVFNDEVTSITSLRELELSAASILSLGSKESLVSVESYGAMDVSEASGGTTGYYAPIESVADAERGIVEVYWDPRDYRAYTRTGRLASSRLTVIVPVRHVVNGAIIGHEGEDEFFLEIKDDYPSYKIPGHCGNLPALPSTSHSGVIVQ